jgi:hypothetical protein
VKLLFQDESGDLGFDFSKRKTSRFFVITLLVMDEVIKRSGDKVVKDVFKRYAGPKSHKEGVLHASRERPLVRRQLLQRIAEKDVRVYAIVLEKKRVNEDLRSRPDKLYNWVTKTLLKYVCKSNVLDADRNRLIASRRETNRLLNNDFRKYVQGQTSRLTPSSFEVTIACPHEEKCLQAVDFICWSIYRAWEYRDDSYEKLIETRIERILPLFRYDKTSCAS